MRSFGGCTALLWRRFERRSVARCSAPDRCTRALFVCAHLLTRCVSAHDGGRRMHVSGRLGGDAWGDRSPCRYGPECVAGLAPHAASLGGGTGLLGRSTPRESGQHHRSPRIGGAGRLASYVGLDRWGVLAARDVADGVKATMQRIESQPNRRAVIPCIVGWLGFCPKRN